MEQIRKDLIELREATGLSQRDFARKTGLGGKVQAIEAGDRCIWVDDLALWLEACGSSLAVYLMHHLDEQERTVLEENKYLYDLFGRALLIERKRGAIKAFFEGIFPVRPPREKTPR